MGLLSGLMLQISQGYIHISYIPKPRSSIHGRTDKYVLNPRVEFDLCDVPGMSLILVLQLCLLGSIDSGVKKPDDGVLTSSQDDVIVAGIKAGWGLVIKHNRLLHHE